MSIQLDNVKLGLLDEGRFLAKSDDLIQAACGHLMAHVAEHGSLAKKAKAEVQLTIKIVCTDPENDAYVIETKNKLSLPADPVKATWAVADTDPDTGAPSLFVRSSGGTAENPRQQVLCTQDGRPVRDGKVVEDDVGKV
jgi:hypothetical protein